MLKLVEAAASAASAELDPMLGKLVAERYRVLSVLGAGGVGRVYHAHQISLDRPVALKILGTQHATDPVFRRRFLMEAAITARLTHPNTVTVFDYGAVEPGTLFIAMELLEGETLSKALAHGPFEQVRAIHVVQQVCRSLREAHAHGVIHRDLKPANIFLSTKGDEHDVVKVLDFGLVKAFNDAADPERSLTRQGIFLGTPQYVAPEQARNQSPDQRADVYSLGVVLFQLLAGRVPFEGESAVDVVLRHIQEPAPSLASVRPDLEVRRELEAIVQRCLAKNREDRFSSMDELLAALGQVRALLTGVSQPPPPQARPTPTVPMSAARTLPTPIASTPVALPAAPLAAPPETPRPELPTAPARSTAPRVALIGAAVLAAAVLAVVWTQARRGGTEPHAASSVARAVTETQAATEPPAAPAAAPAAAPPAAQAPEVAAAAPVEPERNVPAFVLEQAALHMPSLAGPMRALGLHGRHTGAYRVCVGRDGAVSSVDAVQPLPGAEAAALEHIKQRWAFKPQPTRLCSVVVVQLDLH